MVDRPLEWREKMKMKLKFFFAFVCLLSCMDIFAQDIEVTKLNDSILPYKNYKLMFTMVPPTLLNAVNQGLLLEENIGKKEDVFHLTFCNGSVDITINPITEEYINKNLKSFEIIRKAYSEITMLVNYLNGFYFGNLFNSEMKITENNGDILKIENQYEYENISCKNIYTVKNNLLQQIIVSKSDSSENDVSIMYEYLNSNQLHYLSSFQSKNEYQNFLFNLYISYEENNSMLLPTVMKTEVVQNGINTKFEYQIFHQNICNNY